MSQSNTLEETIPSSATSAVWGNHVTAPNTPAGFTVRIEGGNGSCRQSFHRKDTVPPQDFARIKEAAC